MGRFEHKKGTAIGIAFSLVVVSCYLGYLVKRTEFPQYLAAYGLFFFMYGFILFFQNSLSLVWQRFYLYLGIALRVLLLFNIPNLSDDVYRFLWDGRLIANGIHPFAHLPVYFIENQYFPEGITPELFSKLNSPRYYTVYPPVCQAVFALAALISPAGIWGGVVVIKIFLLCCETGTLCLLSGSGIFRPSRFLKPGRCASEPRNPIQPALWYALNPLIIIEIIGNCHFEGAAIFFILAGLHFLNKTPFQTEPGEKTGVSFTDLHASRFLFFAAFCFALAVASKLTPLIFVPAIWRWLGWNLGLRFMLVFALAGLILFLPLFNVQVLSNMAASLDLYFQKFAFNAGIYYVFWEVGLYFKNYNLVNELGPALAPVQLALMGWIAGRLKTGDNPHNLRLALFWTICVYLFFASTVHPWYIALPFALSIGLQRRGLEDKPGWYFPMIWSGLVVLSYSHYHHNAFVEQKKLIALEYALVGTFMIFELIGRAHRSRKKKLV